MYRRSIGYDPNTTTFILNNRIYFLKAYLHTEEFIYIKGVDEMDPAIIVAIISLFGVVFKCFYDSYEKKRENKQDILDTNILIIRYLLLDMEDRCSRVGGKSHEQDMLFTALHD